MTVKDSTMTETTITLTVFQTPLGEMHAAATNEGICLLEFPGPDRWERELDQLKKLLKANVEEGYHSRLTELQRQLKEYFDGNRTTFELELQIKGTPFQEKVWRQLLWIPYGTTRSYRQIAEALEKPGSVRAVGHANGLNRLAIIVPCHRVIGADGDLTGYGGGLWRKRWLLEHELKNCPGPGELFPPGWGNET